MESAARVVALGAVACLGLDRSPISASPQGTAGQGSWSEVYNWAAQLNDDPNGCPQLEMVHAALIPRGPFSGNVLLFRREQRFNGTACKNVDTPITYIFDPSMPDVLIEIEQQLSSDLFCSGQSWDQFGHLVVSGGVPSGCGDPPSPECPDPTCQFPRETYRFRPELLSGELEWDGGDPFVAATVDPGSPPWKRVGDMQIDRYYPTVLQLNRNEIDPNTAGLPNVSGGSNMVVGGPACGGKEGNEYWELLEPELLAATPWSAPVIPSDPDSTDPYYPLGSAGTRNNSPNHTAFGPSAGAYDTYARPFVLPEIPADPLLDSYPRMFQLSNGHILVCGDVDTDLGNPANKAGLTWAIEPSYASGGQWKLYDGKIGGGSGLWHDSFYDTSVILHDLVDGVEVHDRVLMFGGSRNDGGWKVNSRVWEYSRGGAPAQLGTWHDKSIGTDAFKRLYPGAVILPTGEIFVEGGTSTDEMHTTNASTPVRTPIIYDPGVSQTATGTVYPQPAPNVPDWCSACTVPTARLYHHEAILLRSGKVFVVGGKRPTGGGAGEPDPRFTGEVFSPPYLNLQGMGRTRPVIQSAPNNASFSDASTANAIQLSVVRDADKFIDAVVLIRPGANTHHWDNDQRYIELQILSVTTMLEGGRAVDDITLASPDEELGPPGYYMLFAIENDGTGLEGHRIPTVGKFIDIQ